MFYMYSAGREQGFVNFDMALFVKYDAFQVFYDIGILNPARLRFVFFDCPELPAERILQKRLELCRVMVILRRPINHPAVYLRPKPGVGAELYGKGPENIEMMHFNNADFVENLRNIILLGCYETVVDIKLIAVISEFAEPMLLSMAWAYMGFLHSGLIGG